MGDVAVTSGSVVNFASTSTRLYSFDVDPIDFETTVTLAASAAKDLAGNNSSAVSVKVYYGGLVRVGKLTKAVSSSSEARVAVSGNYAYVASRHELSVVDISDAECAQGGAVMSTWNQV